MKLRHRKCKVEGCNYRGDKFFKKWEEKATDVNIAVHMVDDAHKNLCDRFILVSGDSDLVSPIDIIKSTFHEKKVLVYAPARHDGKTNTSELAIAADDVRKLPRSYLKPAQFSRKIPKTSRVGYWEKPKEW